MLKKPWKVRKALVSEYGKKKYILIVGNSLVNFLRDQWNGVPVFLLHFKVLFFTFPIGWTMILESLLAQLTRLNIIWLDSGLRLVTKVADCCNSYEQPSHWVWSPDPK